MIREKKQRRGLLSRGLFEQPFMDSRIRTRSVTMKELVLGHIVGPLGLIMVINTIAALLEIFIMKQMSAAVRGNVNDPMYTELGDVYYWVSFITRLLAMPMGLVTGYLMQRTKSRQGRMRPWYLIFGIIALSVGVLMFIKPIPSSEEAYWIYFYITYVVYNLLGLSFYMLFNNNIVSLSTHNMVDKQKVAYCRKLSWTLISGTLIGMVINSVLLPYVIQPDETLNSFWILICALTVIAIPLLFMEYFYTRERVMEDVQEEVGKEKNANSIPLKEQFRALLHDKCYVLLLISSVVTALGEQFRGTNVQYFYVSYVLGGIHEPSMFMFYTILTGIPLGLGALFIYPLCKKFGIKNCLMVGHAIIFSGCLVGIIFPDNVVIAFIAGFLKQLGFIPAAYMLVALTASCFDSIEHKTGLRLEGLMAVGFITTLQKALYAPVAGLFEKVLTVVGFDANSLGYQPAQALFILGLVFYGIDLISSGANLIVLPFVDIEKRMARITADLLERKKQAVLARGEEWIDPEEHDRREMERAILEREENRLRDLKDRCERKGLDFETENQKYLAKKAERDRMKAQRAERRRARKLAAQEKKKKGTP